MSFLWAILFLVFLSLPWWRWIWFRVYGLGLAVERVHMCSPDDRVHWWMLHFKLYLGVVMVTGDIRLTPNRRTHYGRVTL